MELHLFKGYETLISNQSKAERNELVRRVLDYIPKGVKVSLSNNPITNEIEIEFIKERAVITLDGKGTWEQLTRHIDSKLNMTHKNFECSICYEKGRSTSCGGCSNIFCTKCFINIFKTNQGLIICPFCRFTHGVKMSPEECAQGIINMKHNLL
jgi:hypothetical protein